jgi:hypothetical protein
LCGNSNASHIIAVNSNAAPQGFLNQPC